MLKINFVNQVGDVSHSMISNRASGYAVLRTKKDGLYLQFACRHGDDVTVYYGESYSPFKLPANVALFAPHLPARLDPLCIGLNLFWNEKTKSDKAKSDKKEKKEKDDDHKKEKKEKKDSDKKQDAKSEDRDGAAAKRVKKEPVAPPPPAPKIPRTKYRVRSTKLSDYLDPMGEWNAAAETLLSEVPLPDDWNGARLSELYYAQLNKAASRRKVETVSKVADANALARQHLVDVLRDNATIELPDEKIEELAVPLRSLSEAVQYLYEKRNEDFIPLESKKSPAVSETGSVRSNQTPSRVENPAMLEDDNVSVHSSVSQG
jgi:hypothetical protein